MYDYVNFDDAVTALKLVAILIQLYWKWVDRRRQKK